MKKIHVVSNLTMHIHCNYYLHIINQPMNTSILFWFIENKRKKNINKQVTKIHMLHKNCTTISNLKQKKILFLSISKNLSIIWTLNGVIKHMEMEMTKDNFQDHSKKVLKIKLNQYNYKFEEKYYYRIIRNNLVFSFHHNILCFPIHNLTIVAWVTNSKVHFQHVQQVDSILFVFWIIIRKMFLEVYFFTISHGALIP